MTDILRTQGGDEKITAAIAEAQRRLPEFRRVVEEDSHRILPVYPGALVKVCIDSEAAGAFEHVWLQGVFFEGTDVGGEVVTPVAGDPQLREGARVIVGNSLARALEPGCPGGKPGAISQQGSGVCGLSGSGWL